MSVLRHSTGQAIGDGVDYLNQQRFKGLASDVQKIIEERQHNIDFQNTASVNATEELKKLRDVLGNPEHILGSNKTKHGEIAELLDVYISRSNDFINQKCASATFENVPRLGAADYILNGIEIQSKFINGANNTLKHVIGHMDKYEHFGRDGLYQIPKDQFELISKIIKGEHVEGLKLNSQIAIQNNIAEIEQRTGKVFSEVVTPSISGYNEVQQNVVFNTVDKHEQNILQQHEERINKINNEAKGKENIAYNNHQPSWNEAVIATGIGTLTAATISLFWAIREKKKSGKKISEFTGDDWKEIGIDTVRAGAKGGITGAALYGLTNLAKLSAPCAAALISSAFDITKLAVQYRKGELSIGELQEKSQMICLDSAIAVIGATIGSVIIPIPVLGALIGTIAASVSNDHLKRWLNKDEQKELERMTKEYQEFLESLDNRLGSIINEVNEKYKKLNGMLGMAFNYDIDVFIKLDASISFAREMEVSESEIIHDTKELDAFLGY